MLSFFNESFQWIALMFLFCFLRNTYQKQYSLVLCLEGFFSFSWRELEPFWLLVVLNDGGQKYNPNASFLTVLAGRVMYVTGAHPVGTCWCLIWNLFGSVFYAFYFSIPLFFNSSGCLVVLCAHDNSLSLGWSLHPPLWDTNKGLFWASVWRRH